MSEDRSLDVQQEVAEEMEKPVPPVRFELVSDELFAIINLHDMRQGENAFACWSYISEGLSKNGQKELAIFIKQRPGEKDDDYPMDPLGFYLTVRQFAEQGQFVMDGDITEFGESGFIDPIFKAMAYVRPFGVTGLDNQDSLLSCILLTEAELAVARRFGLARVLALMGFNFSHFPCPPWVDRNRNSVITDSVMHTMEESILAKVPQFVIPGLRVMLNSTKVIVKCKNGTHHGLRELLKQIPDEAPVVLLGELDPEANAILVWQADNSKGPSAITPPGSDGTKVGGCAVLFFPEQDQTNAQVIEDSFLVSLTTKDWVKLRNGLMTGKDTGVGDPNQRTELQWYDEDPNAIGGYARPVPGLPIIEPPDAPGKVLDAKLLSSESDLVKAMDPGILAQFVAAIQMMVLGYYMDRGNTVEKKITVRGELLEGRKANWQLSSEPSEDKLELKGIEIRMSDLPIPDIVEGPVKFEILFEIPVKS